MSVWSHERDYQEVQDILADVRREDVYVSSLSIPEDSKSCNEYIRRYWLSIYLRYLRLSQRLATLHDTELQPQKVQDVRTLLNSCLGRMLEVKDLLVKKCGDFIFLDDALLDLKMLPEQAEPPIPTYLVEDREDELCERRSAILSLQLHYKTAEPDAPVSIALEHPRAQTDPSKAVAPFVSSKAQMNAIAVKTSASDNTEEELPLSLEEAVHILQTCERGRQARQRAAFQLALLRQKRYLEQNASKFYTITGKDYAASIVQRVALGYLERKLAQKRYLSEKQFLGMMLTERILGNEEQTTASIRAQKRKSRQRMGMAELKCKTSEIEDHLKVKEGPKTMEEMLDEILMHMAYARMEGKEGDDASTAVPVFPSLQEGGSLKMLGRLPTDRKDSTPSAVLSGLVKPKNHYSQGNKSLSSISASPFSKRKDSFTASYAVGGSAPELASKLSIATRRSRQSEVWNAAVAGTTASSTFWKQMNESAQRYESVWRPHYQQHCLQDGNLDRKMDESALRDELLQGSHGILSELRRCVDELVMLEVQNLQAKLESERKAKRGKRATKKKTLEQKKPKLRDPTKGVDLETAMNTVVYDNKWQLPPPTILLRDFVGPEMIMATPLDQQLREQRSDENIVKKWKKILRNWDDAVGTAMGGIKKEEFTKLFEIFTQQSTYVREPSAAQIRRAAVEYAVLPLGSQVLHDLAPHANSLFFYGFPSSGKTMMAFAICNEAGANFFNLSPANFASTKDLSKMVQLVFYLARVKGPSVIYMDNIEKVFPDKEALGKKERKRNPLIVRGKKIKKEIIKGLNSLQPPDRVLLIATSSEPWMADRAALINMFPHAIWFPLPDYTTRMHLLKYFVLEKLPPDQDKGTIAAQIGSPFLYEQLALLTEGWAVGQIKDMVDKTLNLRCVRRLLQRPLKADDFVPALAQGKAPSKECLNKMLDFHKSLPFMMRRANPPEDFPGDENTGKNRVTVRVSTRSKTP